MSDTQTQTGILGLFKVPRMSWYEMVEEDERIEREQKLKKTEFGADDSPLYEQDYAGKKRQKLSDRRSPVDDTNDTNITVQ